MSSVGGKLDDERYSVIEDKGRLDFVDFQDDKSVCSYSPDEEGPIVISVPFPFLNGKPRSVLVGERVVEAITIKNTTKEPVELWNVTIYASSPEKSFMLSLMEPPPANADEKTIKAFVEFECLEDRVLQPLEALTVWLSCKPTEIGLHQTAVQFDVGDDRLERVVFLLADDKISHSLTSKKPYSRNTRKTQVNVQSYVKGSRPAGKVTNRCFKNRLPEFKIPKDIRELVERKRIPDVLNEELWKGNYSIYFKVLLILEEIQLEEDMRSHDMESVSMRRKGNQYLALEVPGLAEKRPSLVQGDFILAKLASGAGSDASNAYQGYIHRVEADEVYLKFDQEFHSCHRDGNLYDVKFTYNRINMRRLYQAIHATEYLDTSFLFPSDSSRRMIKTFALRPISCTLNEEQICSVEMILGCKGAPPYVIHGPPGTGKTMTLVEAILQIYRHRQNARILVCAPSNTAADNILEKLLNQKAVELKENSIFRLNAASRPYDDVKPDLMQFCFFDELIFICPPLNALISYRVIISTYMSASLLYAEGIAHGHFTHIFLDEAGQASEPETMIPISNFSQRKTVVVLAGDPMQLGPVVYSKEAENYGYRKSYLERLFESMAYFDEDENYVTKLVRNYRSHAEILHLPSTLFYNGELIACREDANCINSFADFIPNKEFPILFIGVQGCDEREGNNPSWFNRIEASKVVEIIKKLMESGMGLREEDIGVITPYRQQVLKLKKALENCDVPDIKVGSVEQFQGQERKVIIVSTVRSTVKHNNFDKSHCLGFLSNPRRFNVAVTRAISLLIIIGNPHIICQDTYWNKLLWHCLDNNSYQGCSPPLRVDNDMNNEENPHWSEQVESWKGDEWGQESGSQTPWNEESYNQNSWNEDPSNQNSWNEDPPGQNSWNEDPPGQNSWNEDPSDQNSWNKAPHGKNSWNEAPHDQNSWNEAPPGHNSWNEAPSDHNSWNEAPPDQNTWNEDPPDQKSWNEAPHDQNSWNEAPPDHKSWNEASPDQNSWNEAPHDPKSWNEEPSNEKLLNEEPSNLKKSLNEEPSNQKLLNEEPSNEKSLNEEPSNQKPLSEEPSNEKSLNKEPSNQKSSNEEPSNQKSSNEEHSNQKPWNEEPWSEAWELGSGETEMPKSIADEADEWI